MNVNSNCKHRDLELLTTTYCMQAVMLFVLEVERLRVLAFMDLDCMHTIVIP